MAWSPRCRATHLGGRLRLLAVAPLASPRAPGTEARVPRKGRARLEALLALAARVCDGDAVVCEHTHHGRLLFGPLAGLPCRPAIRRCAWAVALRLLDAIGRRRRSHAGGRPSGGVGLPHPL
eukprot:scaffold15998_cov111-Isochrysis_galbana.AAC.5